MAAVTEEQLQAVERKLVDLSTSFDNFKIATETEMNQVEEKYRKGIAGLHERLDDGAARGQSVKLNFASAKKYMPGEFDGVNKAFKTFLAEVRTYLVALDDDAEEMLVAIMRQSEEFSMSQIKEPTWVERIDKVKALDRELGLTLQARVRGDAKTIIDGMNIRDGFKAIQRLGGFYAPRSEVDEAAALEPLQRPRQAKNLTEFRVNIEAWEAEVRKFEMKYSAIQDTVKINAIKSMAPDVFYTNHLQGQSFRSSQDIKQKIHMILKDKRYQDAREPTGSKKKEDAPSPMDIGSLAKAAGVEPQQFVDDLMAVMKGGGKGSRRSDYGGWKGGQQGDWREGKGGQPRGPNPYWKPWNGYQQKGDQSGRKGDPKGGKAKGKGRKEHVCWKCGGKGHPAHKCSSPDNMDIGAVDKSGEDDEDEREEEDPDEEAEDLAYMGEIGMQCVECNNHQYNEDIEKPPGLEEWKKVKSKKTKKKEKAWVKVEEIQKDIKIQKMMKNVDDLEKDMLCLGSLDIIDDMVGLGAYETGYAQAGGLCPISNLGKVISRKDGRHRFLVTVDSGAADNVIPKGMFPDVPLQESPGSVKGQYWVSAKGGKIYNLGQKVIEFVTEEGHAYKITFQVADVTKPLLSAYKVGQKGNVITLNKDNPKIESADKKKVTKLRMEGKVYVMDCWTRAKVFARQGM